MAYVEDLDSDPSVDAALGDSHYLYNWINPIVNDGWSPEVSAEEDAIEPSFYLLTDYDGDITFGTAGYFDDAGDGDKWYYSYDKKLDILICIRRDFLPNEEILNKLKIKLSKAVESGKAVERENISSLEEFLNE